MTEAEARRALEERLPGGWLLEMLEHAEWRAQIRAARDAGASWTSIAGEVGITLARLRSFAAGADVRHGRRPAGDRGMGRIARRPASCASRVRRRVGAGHVVPRVARGRGAPGARRGHPDRLCGAPRAALAPDRRGAGDPVSQGVWLSQPPPETSRKRLAFQAKGRGF